MRSEFTNSEWYEPEIFLLPKRSFQKTIAVFQDLDFALTKKFDLVVVANPTYLHLETLIKALKTGAHVYVEKPIAHEKRS